MATRERTIGKVPRKTRRARMEPRGSSVICGVAPTAVPAQGSAASCEEEGPRRAARPRPPTGLLPGGFAWPWEEHESLRRQLARTQLPGRRGERPLCPVSPGPSPRPIRGNGNRSNPAPRPDLPPTSNPRRGWSSCWWPAACSNWILDPLLCPISTWPVTKPRKPSGGRSWAPTRLGSPTTGDRWSG
jgi:hypothetical protein